jgi:hypothetical protein
VPQFTLSFKSAIRTASDPTTSTTIIIAARINLNQKRDSFSLKMGLAADLSSGTDVIV